MHDNIQLTGEVLRQKWKQFAVMVGIPDDEQLKLSEGWLRSFKERHGLKERKRHGEAGSASQLTVEEERQRVQKIISDGGYRPRDVFNMDETGLFYALPPDRGLANKKHSGVKGKKVRLTYALTMNANGSERLEPLIIGKACKPRAFKNKTGDDLGFYYRNNAKAWMTTGLYQEWLRDWDRKLVDRKILLLQDNFSGHKVPDGLENIRVENFRANLTAHIQPADQGIIRCFKAHYRARYINCSINRYDRGITPAEIYDINQLSAMRIAAAAWRNVDATTIQHCWRKSDILPDNFLRSQSSPGQPSILISALVNNHTAESYTHAVQTVDDPVTVVEQAVVIALDGLTERGPLHRSNRMDIESLLNPAEESVIIDGTTDQEIYQAVMDALEAEQNAIINGGVDDVDDDGPDEDLPTHREVLDAAAVIGRYLDHENDIFARKLEGLLFSLKRNLRLQSAALVPTRITDYFHRDRA
ncbi:hypothetical protein M378DRAFT_74681 [Amanita muscaria Koide BX008]|uniref:HTH CENPB-type domain-containing protein n=1 Tax=Amanita muscaria (strain Koide BX008) TaxID=946122 RepID=A0A0C2XBI1_AMAMK|nr:hypothetical protein M378DRAFT_74681 [Amanita muscaria Koide BX008]